MRFGFAIGLAALGIFLGGCASKPQVPVALTEGTLSSSAGKVGVLMTPVPKVDTQFPGAGCLLCYAFASASNSSLTKYTQTLPNGDLAKIGEEIAATLTKKGIQATVVPDAVDLSKLPDATGSAPNIAKKDFSSLRTKYKLDKLVVINLVTVGYLRTYSSYIPTSDPKATVAGEGYMVDLKTNTYDWFLPVVVSKSADGPWDEPPKYPGLTNAYFQAIETSRDSILKPLGGSQP